MIARGKAEKRKQRVDKVVSQREVDANEKQSEAEQEEQSSYSLLLGAMFKNPRVPQRELKKTRYIKEYIQTAKEREGEMGTENSINDEDEEEMVSLDDDLDRESDFESEESDEDGEDSENENDEEEDEEIRNFMKDQFPISLSNEQELIDQFTTQRGKKQLMGEYLAKSRIDVSDSITNSLKTIDRGLLDSLALASSEQSTNGVPLTDIQEDCYSLLSTYLDVCYFTRSLDKEIEVRGAYVLHVLNHILKTRRRVLKNSERIRILKAKGQAREDDIRELKDQSFTRTTVLILVPFKSRVVSIVKLLLKMLPQSMKKQVENAKKFKNEFDSTSYKPKTRRSADFMRLFSGDYDDCFRMGIQFSRKSVKLFAPFSKSDIVIASPLGLQLMFGSKSTDFLSSIEIAVMDGIDIFYFQNWSTVEIVLENLNRKPSSIGNVDIFRVRDTALDEKLKFCRQTISLSTHMLADIKSLYSRFCHNHRGNMFVGQRDIVPSMKHVLHKLRKVFINVFCGDPMEIDDVRFDLFTRKLLPSITKSECQTLIYIPSSLDYYRIQSFLEEKEIPYCDLSEEREYSEISRSRRDFKKKEKRIALLTERLHFFRRYAIQGAETVVFYSPPTFSSFYSEVVNMISITDSSSAVVLYSELDMFQMSRIVGIDRYRKILAEKIITHTFI